MSKVRYNNMSFASYISKEEIKRIVNELGDKINSDYKNTDGEIVLISILDGAFVFMADLIRTLDFEFTVEFVKISSYDGTESLGFLELVLDIQKDIQGKHVLVVEDIVDSGLTLEMFINSMKERHPASLKVCTLLSKPDVHNDFLDLDYIGMEIPPAFVIGYGLDIDGKGRNLDAIYQLETE